jgi:hypothetical protein
LLLFNQNELIDQENKGRKRKMGMMDLLCSPKKRKSLTSQLKDIENSAISNPGAGRSIRQGRGLNLKRRDPP